MINSMQQHDETKLVIWPNEGLHSVCSPVTDFDGVKQIIRELFTTVRQHYGIGLAAPQIGRSVRVFVLDIEDESYVFINPEIITSSEQLVEWEEGCLSVPGYFEKRKRPNKIIIKHQSADGEWHEKELIGIWAFAAQHELDHLNGKVFVDGLSPLKTSRIKKKISKTLRHYKTLKS